MESITLELRPLLRSLSASILLINKIDSSKIEVKLLEDTIEIHVENKIYNFVLPNVKLLPSSLSSLVVANRWISFRTLTQPNFVYGKFESEIVNLENEFKNNFSFCSYKTELPPSKVNCELLCSCCKNEISKTLCFQRILPLPSSGCEPQEWFCHKHDDDQDSYTLEPKETDLFYYVNYFLLNKLVFKENLKVKNSLVHCNRCFSILGSTETNKKSIKVWNACIEYRICCDKNIVKCTKSALTDFLWTLKDTAELLIGETILLEAQESSNTHFIFLKIMETKLNILTLEKLSLEDHNVELNPLFVIKVLYKYGVNEKTKNSDQNIKYCEVAIPSILAGIDQLISSTTRFPPAYRKAEDFYIGYLPI